MVLSRRPSTEFLPASALLLLASCATGGSGPPGPIVSPTGFVYPLGSPPAQTRFSQTAALYLNRDRFDRALEQAVDGITAAPDNPIHYYLAGLAHVRLGAYAEADAVFTTAERLYPAYELDIEPVRERAWADAYNAGLEAYARGDVEATVDAWQQAMAIYDRRPDAHRNLAWLLSEQGGYDEAIRIYQRALAGLEKGISSRVLEEDEVRARADAALSIEEDLSELLLLMDRFVEAEPLLRHRLRRDTTSVQVGTSLAAALNGLGRVDEARQIQIGLLSQSSLTAADLFRIGGGLFRLMDYAAAAEAFGRLAALEPNSRDAWFNYVNALFAVEAWTALVPVVDRLIELDPLGEQAALIAARAYLEAGNDTAAARRLDRIDSAPVHLAEVRMRHSGAETSITGLMIGNEAEPGTPIRLRFTIYESTVVLGSEILSVPAPAAGESTSFVVSFGRRGSAHAYEWLDAP